MMQSADAAAAAAAAAGGGGGVGRSGRDGLHLHASHANLPRTGSACGHASTVPWVEADVLMNRMLQWPSSYDMQDMPAPLPFLIKQPDIFAGLIEFTLDGRCDALPMYARRSCQPANRQHTSLVAV
jgi:hypothetical protein